ncbi:unnamed protein product (mitochondrion) [Plasmodiophora brassicae]|uniref:Inositol polyphosphate-related phosphatase domain-containing protein n=1 Tax=Plasmodiophora brassicae TaxID=37360 RepID=A0A0G4INJ5_PLABS|nr:hypothetical protein PBRA_005410 [Plasmodiophora brassicae]SPR00653.1 unnamed protein product [Plasmodiophora brassicae]
MGGATRCRSVVVVAVAVCLASAIAAGAPGRVVLLTWNLADGFPSGAEVARALRFALHGLPDDDDADSLPELIVFGVQEARIRPRRAVADWIRDAVNDHYFAERRTRYDVVGVATSRWGQWVPKHVRTWGHHLSGVVVLRRASSNNTLARVTTGTSYCRWWSRGEKAISAVALTTGSGHRLCFLSAHLPSANMKSRVACLRHAFRGGQLGPMWDGCSARFLIGDLNSRTDSPTTTANVSDIVAKCHSWHDLVAQDEMTRALVGRVNSLRGLVCTAGLHLPTYKLLVRPDTRLCMDTSACIDIGRLLKVRDWDAPVADGNCGPGRVCYDATRPVSWTDQILFDPDQANLEFVAAVHAIHSSDHLPLVGRFAFTLK